MEQTQSPLSVNAPIIQSGSTEEMIRLLSIQNQLLRELNQNLAHSMEENSDERLSLRARILDVDMSIGSMVGFMFKWLIASIPVAIVIGVVYVFIFVLILGSASRF